MCAKGGARGLREEKAQMDAMQTHIQSLMKMVESTKAPSVVKAVSELSGVKLVPLTEHDDIEAYLVTFERKCRRTRSIRVGTLLSTSADRQSTAGICSPTDSRLRTMMK